MPEYYAWKESLMGNASGWTIKYYKVCFHLGGKQSRSFYLTLCRQSVFIVIMYFSNGFADLTGVGNK